MRLALLLPLLAAGCLPDLVPFPTDDGGTVGSNPSPDLSMVGGASDDLSMVGGNNADLAGKPPRDMAGQPPPDLAGQPPPDLAMLPPDMAVNPNCIPKTSPQVSGHHNAGQSCLNCHDGSQAPLFYAGGTLYNAATGGTAVAGATIEVVDANNLTQRFVTGQNGNFYFEEGFAQPIAFPAKVRASGCPVDNPMNTQLTDGNCNRSSCHSSAMRVHLP